MTYEEVIKTIEDGDLEKVDFDLTSVDGNAFVLMGGFQQRARKTWTKDQIDAVLTECITGDYNHLVATLMEVTL